MRAIFSALVMILAPGSAVALSCDAYSIRGAYWFYDRQPETYVLAQGVFSGLTLIETTRSQTMPDEFKPGKTIYSARFEGFRASRRAFDQPFSTEVTLVFPDYSFIGGGYDTASAAERMAGTPGLVWLQENGSSYQLTAELCLPVIDTDPASVKPALRCLRGGNCPG